MNGLLVFMWGMVAGALLTNVRYYFLIKKMVAKWRQQ